MSFSLSTVLLVQAFWFSLLAIGYLVTASLQKRYKNKFIDGWSEFPLAGKILLSAASAFTIFSIFTVIGYIFRLPGWWLGFSYLLVLASAIFLGISYVRKEIAKDITGLGKSIRNLRPWSPGFMLVLVLIADFIICLYMGMNLGGDSPVHIAKIRHLVGQGFTIEDAYYGGIPETRHHISILHTLFAIPTWFKVEAFQSWFLSIGFLKFLKSLAVYFLAYRLADRFKPLVRELLAVGTTIMSLVLFSNYALGLPTDFALVWLILLTIAVLEVVVHRNYWLMILASGLLALTHSIGAVCGLLIIGTSALAIILFNRRIVNKKMILAFVASGLLLISTPLFTLSLPNQISDAAWESGADKFGYFSLGNFEALQPTVTQFSRLNNGPLLSILSVIGLAYLIFVVKRKAEKLIIASIIVIVPLIINNPLAFSLLHKFLPVWGIERLTGANQLFLLFVPFGLFATIIYILRFIKILKPNMQQLLAGACVMLFAFGAFPFVNSFNSLRLSEPTTKGYRSKQQKYLSQIEAINSVAPNDTGAVVLAEDYPSLLLPAVSPVHVLAIRDARATPASDNQQRRVCRDLIINNLDKDLMDQVRIKYLVAARSSDLDDIAKSDRNLKLTKTESGYNLYRNNLDQPNAKTNKQCEFNE